MVPMLFFCSHLPPPRNKRQWSNVLYVKIQRMDFVCTCVGVRHSVFCGWFEYLIMTTSNKTNRRAESKFPCCNICSQDHIMYGSSTSQAEVQIVSHFYDGSNRTLQLKARTETLKPSKNPTSNVVNDSPYVHLGELMRTTSWGLTYLLC